MTVRPLLEGGGKLLFPDGHRDPIPLLLECADVKRLANQRRIHLREKPEVGWSEIRALWGVVDHPDVFGGQKICNSAGGVGWCIIPMKIEALLSLGGAV